ncbi:hypothetical protein SKAU_G00137580 [Synaphobranchus kaupii]|uniref:Uncharacterized protein n=1 Tax=Synaphobranchus kaupii TaxID=118154 RepID=A0A9Q1FRP6_SYNKA|nr:hypothetical protein SKAU_G00137580 [Synaphobranchus kaupii]
MAAFAEATRILFRIIQTTHHLQNTAVSGGRTTSPASLQKKMQELATLVRPASPTDNTMVKLAGNALNWLHTCMQILEEHYLENMGHLTKKLENIHLSNWPEAFQVATRWAKKKFGRRLHPTTLDIAEKTFTPILTPRSTTSAVSTNNRFSVLADTPPPTTGRTTVAPPQDQYQREWPALRQTYPPGSPAPRRNAERTVLPQEALHHQRNRTSSGITGHHRDWEPTPVCMEKHTLEVEAIMTLTEKQEEYLQDVPKELWAEGGHDIGLRRPAGQVKIQLKPGMMGP